MFFFVNVLDQELMNSSSSLWCSEMVSSCALVLMHAMQPYYTCSDYKDAVLGKVCTCSNYKNVAWHP